MAFVVVSVEAELYGGWTGWPFEPLVLAVALSATAAVATQRRRVAVAMVAAWAALACPFPVTSSEGGFATTAPGELRARGVRGAQAVTGRAQLVKAGSLPVGMLWLRREERMYLVGDGSSADADLVAYTAGWLPYPHVQRTVVHPLGGSILDNWASEQNVQLRQDGNRTIVVGRRADANYAKHPELRPLGLTVSRSNLTLLGWILLLAGWAAGRMDGKGRHPTRAQGLRAPGGDDQHARAVDHGD